jgi:hypothetical protein
MRAWFTENMTGHYTRGAQAYDAGDVAGQRDWNPVSFRLTIGTDDLRSVLKDPDHRMPVADGIIRCKEFSPMDMDVENGTFDLFTRGGAGRYLMRYRLPFRTEDHQPMTLLGFKEVGDDWGFDMWTDTTTLFTRIMHGTADHDAGTDQEHARGILRLNALMFARQLTTFRGTAVGIGRFGAFFMHRLLDAYSGPRRKRPIT